MKAGQSAGAKRIQTTFFGLAGTAVEHGFVVGVVVDEL
jgi:hypothetical protein